MQSLENTQILEMKFIHEQLNRRGIEEDSIIHLQPFLAKQKKVVLNRTKLSFCTDNVMNKNHQGMVYRLGRLGKEKLNFQLTSIKTTSLNGQARTRYLMVSHCQIPFCLNGNYVLSSYIEQGDKVEMGYNSLSFERRRGATEELFSFTLSQKKMINSELPILISGETGTGKTTLAKYIHESTRPQEPFVHVNLSSFSEKLMESELFGHVKGAFTGAISEKVGAFEQAKGGTLFIDEIDSLPIEIQTKLLLFLDEKKLRKVGGTKDKVINCRLIFASGRDLQHLVKIKQMRKDFYFRLASGMSFKLKSLRDDNNKVQKFCEDFEVSQKVHLPQDLIEFYQTLPWPGNIRQLKAHLDKKKLLSVNNKMSFDELDEKLMTQSNDLFDISETLVKELTMSELKFQYVQGMLQKYKNNKSAVAKILGISTRSVKNITDKV